MTNSADDLGFRPLYQQVKEVFISRIIQSVWKPGSILPSEQQLARELNVSQGTVRRALDAMTDERLLVRKQGRGTFVAEHDQERILFQYFKISADDGEKHYPTSKNSHTRKTIADTIAAKRLDINEGDPIWIIERHRNIQSKPMIFETIHIPVSVIPDLGSYDPPPNNLYELFARTYGLTISRALEQLKAVNANDTIANALGCAPGTAVLQINRRAFNLDGTVAEWRCTYCLTEDVHYVSDLD